MKPDAIIAVCIALFCLVMLACAYLDYKGDRW